MRYIWRCRGEGIDAGPTGGWETAYKGLTPARGSFGGRRLASVWGEMEARGGVDDTLSAIPP